jgi:CRISPR-associated protein Cas5t
MIVLRLTVPIACWRRGQAREFLETEDVPPPASCYGALLSLVGEESRHRHAGARVTAGLANSPARSTVLRTLWRVKDAKVPAGTSENARPDYQEVLMNSVVVVYCDSRDEREESDRLEERVRRALRDPASIARFGGWSLGESTHLINDVSIMEGDELEATTSNAFLLTNDGSRTLPVWVDHVGTEGTRYATGALERVRGRPDVERMPRIEPQDSREAAPRRPRSRKSTT